MILFDEKSPQRRRAVATSSYLNQPLGPLSPLSQAEADRAARIAREIVPTVAAAEAELSRRDTKR